MGHAADRGETGKTAGAATTADMSGAAGTAATAGAAAKGQAGRQSLAAAFANAGNGIRLASKGRNFRIECCFAVAAAALGWWLGIDGPSWLAVILCCMIVLSLECANTAIEAVTDLASPELHPLAKTAKDCAAGAALLASIGSVVCAFVIFLPPFLERIGVVLWT